MIRILSKSESKRYRALRLAFVGKVLDGEYGLEAANLMIAFIDKLKVMLRADSSAVEQ